MARRKQYECLAKVEPGEPVFVLIGRDRASASVIKIWAHLWQQEISLGLRSEDDRPQISQALKIARDMEIFERDRRQRREHNGLTFDDHGIPLTGPHARKEHNSTSGALD